MISADDKFHTVANELINKYGLQKEKVTGVIAGNNIGDSYFFISALPYVQQKLDRQFIIFTQGRTNVSKYIEIFENNNVHINHISLDINLLSLFYDCSDEVKDSYYEIIYPLNVRYIPRELINWGASQDTKLHLARPKYPDIDIAQKYPHININEGKTVFVIPDSNWHRTLKPMFWICTIRLFLNMGYSVIINSKTDRKWVPGAQYLLPDVQDIVPICNKCGLVFGIRTGLMEIVAAETTARSIVVDMWSDSNFNISKTYPFAPSDRIQYIPIKNVRSCGFTEIDNWMHNNLSSHDATSSYAAYMMAKHNPALHYYTADVKSYARGKSMYAFDTCRKIPRKPFCKIDYAVNVENIFLVIHLSINPDSIYEIHAVLIDTVTNTQCDSVDYVSSNTIVFKIPCSGIYRVHAQIFHPTQDLASEFYTRRLQINIDPLTLMVHCAILRDYINILKSCASDTLILISSRDAHTNWKLTQKLFLEELNLKLQPEKKMRYSYLAIIDAGEVMLEQESKDQELQAQYDFDGNRAELVSAGYNVNMNDKTSISIKINGIEYAVDRRGLNFVIWSKRDNRVIDSVAFDTFLESSPCFRKRV